MIRQALAMTRMNLSALPQRWGSALVDVFGVACVVAVFVGLFSIVSSYRQMMVSNADESTLIVLKASAESESASTLTKDEADSVATIVRAGDDAAIVSPEMSRFISLKNPNAAGYVEVALRGVTSEAEKIRSRMKLIAGRFPQAGRYELLVGRGAQKQFQGLKLGDTLRLADADWAIVGAFEAGGGAIESEVWTDLPMLQSAFRLGNGVHSVRVKPSNILHGAGFAERLQANATLGVAAHRENDYFQGSVQNLFNVIRAFAYPLLIVMVIGAVFAGINTMYGAVAARTKEIGTARAIGFGALPVALSVIVEAVLLALLGGLLGVVLIYFALNGAQANSNFLTDRQYAFTFVVSPDVMRQGVLWALVIGVVGGLLPALRAGRMPVVRALSES
jgi:putative ABC transport system permease protein